MEGHFLISRRYVCKYQIMSKKGDIKK